MSYHDPDSELSRLNRDAVHGGGKSTPIPTACWRPRCAWRVRAAAPSTRAPRLRTGNRPLLPVGATSNYRTARLRFAPAAPGPGRNRQGLRGRSGRAIAAGAGDDIQSMPAGIYASPGPKPSICAIRACRAWLHRGLHNAALATSAAYFSRRCRRAGSVGTGDPRTGAPMWATAVSRCARPIA